MPGLLRPGVVMPVLTIIAVLSVSCLRYLGNVGPGGDASPQVALLFLTRGPMPLEPAWREFFESATLLQLRQPAGLQHRLAAARLAPPYSRPGATVPDEASLAKLGGQGSGRHASNLSAPLRATQRRNNRRLQARRSEPQSWSTHALLCDDTIAQQSLYSVYVHTAPGFSYAPGNLFAGYEVGDRVQVVWGQHSVVVAERLLLAAALQSKANQRFLLLSERCLPLYPPGALYAQLMSEQLSRIHACAADSPADQQRRVMHRWDWEMASDRFTDQHWRKSSQWATLLRPHAQLAVDDTDISPHFASHCFTYLPNITLALPAHVQALLDAGVNLTRKTCVSDEHYIPSLLAAHGLDAQTDCTGVLTHSDWAWPNWSPKLYTHLEVNSGLVHSLRSHRWFSSPPGQCDYGAMLASASRLFGRRGSWDLQPHDLWASFRPLPHACSLFARKFDSGALDAVIRQGQDCEAGFGWSPLCVNV